MCLSFNMHIFLPDSIWNIYVNIVRIKI